MKILQKLPILLLVILSLELNAAPRVAVSIAPIHSLAAMVLEGVGEPDLILPGVQSPHTFSLTPSSARKVLDADLVVYVSDSYETGLGKMLENVKSENRLMLMEMQDQLTILSQRRGGRWESHLYVEGDKSGHAPDDDLGDRASPDLNDKPDDHSGNFDHRFLDPHLWLSPDNAAGVILLLRDRLSLMDPVNAQLYLNNAKAAINKINNHSELVRHKLQFVSHQPYLVFHDAFQYFESYYNLNTRGSVSLGPEQKPGARRISELRQLIEEEGIRCIFSEPQFEPRMVSNLTEDLNIARGELDPLGAGIDQGIELWFKLTIGLAESLNNCLN